MGFLIALVAPKLIDMTAKSKRPIAKTSISRIGDAAERHTQEIGKLPNDLSEVLLKK